MAVMALFTKKKNYRFEVTVGIEELNSVPFVNGVLFAKLRMVNVRHSSQYSPREEIKNHRVRWNSEHTFQCKMFANMQNSVLEPHEMKISIRKETKGGKSYHKVGYVSVNLSCFAAMGGGPTKRRYILDGYNQKKRQDNSLLQVNFAVRQVFGDQCFRVPDEDLSRCIPYDADLGPGHSRDLDVGDDSPGTLLIKEEAELGEPGSLPPSNNASLTRHTRLMADGHAGPHAPPSTLSLSGNVCGACKDSPCSVTCPDCPMNSLDSPETAALETDSFDLERDSASPLVSPGHHPGFPDIMPNNVCKQCGHLRSPSADMDMNDLERVQCGGCNQPMDAVDCVTSNLPNGVASHNRGSSMGHMRHLSSLSGISTGGVCTNCSGGGTTGSSGYRSHSRQSSLDSACQFNKFSYSSNSIDRSLDRKRERKGCDPVNIKQQQLNSTRVDNDLVVSEILRSRNTEKTATSGVPSGPRFLARVSADMRTTSLPHSCHQGHPVGWDGPTS